MALLLAAGGGLGLAAAWLEGRSPDGLVPTLLGVTTLAALIYGAGAWWGYIRALREDDEWD